MRMSCNGCRVLRKGCSEDCSIRPCLQWIQSPESQANATVFLAKFYGRAGLLNLINAGPQHLRPAIFRSLLYEACGRLVNPIYGSVGLLWCGSWQLCQSAVEAVLKGEPIKPITSEAATNGRTPPSKFYDIRHVLKDENSVNEAQRVKAQFRSKRTGGTLSKSKVSRGVGSGSVEPETIRSTSHESSLSHLSDVAMATREGENNKESESGVSMETDSVLFHDEPESIVKVSDRTGESEVKADLELTLGFEPVSRAHHMVPVKKRKFQFGENDSWKIELGLEFSA